MSGDGLIWLCKVCGLHHPGGIEQCALVRAVDYYPDGALKRVEKVPVDEWPVGERINVHVAKRAAKAHEEQAPAGDAAPTDQERKAGEYVSTMRVAVDWLGKLVAMHRDTVNGVSVTVGVADELYAHAARAYERVLAAEKDAQEAQGEAAA